ncbi:MAG TPA: non-heme iron oxygenase ferredoxin subunit [Steroidobacteraceae bacterium]
MPCEWVDVGASVELSEARPLAVEFDDVDLIIARCGDRLYAVENRCTHDGQSLTGAEIESCEIICPRHGARFCLRSGEALTPPAYEALRTFNVCEEQGRILLERPA